MNARSHGSHLSVTVCKLEIKTDIITENIYKYILIYVVSKVFKLEIV